MAAFLYVRGKSDLECNELERRHFERKPRFRDVPGLLQTVYGRDPETGPVCGISLFDTAVSLSRFAESELARTIAQACEAMDVRKEVSDVLYALRPKRVPLRRLSRTGAERDGT